MLLAPQDSGGYAAQYLKPQHMESVTMPRPMFVFLNACQVGAGQRVLGDCAGLATAFLSAGAAGVVAALWNVHDLAARDVAVNFYRDLDANAVPVAALCGGFGRNTPGNTRTKTQLAGRRCWPTSSSATPTAPINDPEWRHRLSSHISTWRTPPGRRTRDALSSS